MRRGFWIVSLLLASVLLYAQGDHVLNVVSSWGGRTVYNTGDVKKISFSGSELLLLDSEETTHSFDISELLSLHFRNYPDLTPDPTIVAEKEVLSGLYPNPANDRLYVDSRLMDKEGARVEVWNLNGNVLISEKTLSTDQGINISGLGPGIYICRFFSHREVISLKFMKQ